MTRMTHTAMPLGARDVAAANSGALGSSHLAMIKRFAKFALMVGGFFLLMIAVMSIKYAAFFLHLPH
jgi:hypothetical protein